MKDSFWVLRHGKVVVACSPSRDPYEALEYALRRRLIDADTNQDFCWHLSTSPIATDFTVGRYTLVLEPHQTPEDV